MFLREIFSFCLFILSYTLVNFARDGRLADKKTENFTLSAFTIRILISFNILRFALSDRVHFLFNNSLQDDIVIGMLTHKINTMFCN